MIGILQLLTLFDGCNGQDPVSRFPVTGRTGMSNGAVPLSPWSVWLTDITAQYAPDYVDIYIDPRNGACETYWNLCDAPCDVILPDAIAHSQTCGEESTIQQLANQIYGNYPYFAIGIFKASFILLFRNIRR